MLSRKSSILLCSYSSLSPLCYASSPHPQSCTSCACPRPSLQSPPQTRAYAQSTSHPSVHPPPRAPSHCNESDLHWPPHSAPTPYQILSLRRGDVYSKQRFYSLVKLYHPDRYGPSSPVGCLPHSLRIERYRLLIAAHAILSDDEKRRAYDLWGHGWTAGHDPSNPSHAPNGWAHEPRRWKLDPMMNATWEDWEKWYQQEYNGPQREASRDLYMNNFAFISLLLSLVSVGLVLQGTRANIMSSSYMEQQEKIHKAASMELARSKRATLMGGDRDERIRNFLEHREAVLSGDEAYHRLLPPSETCAPDTVRK